MHEEEEVLAWTIDSPAGKVLSSISNHMDWWGTCIVYGKLVTTTLRYTPVVLEHHVPYKKLHGERLWAISTLTEYLADDILSKAPSQTPKLKGLQKLILSYFHNVVHIMGQLTAYDMLVLVVNENAKLIPYVVSSRKPVKAYLKVWANADYDFIWLMLNTTRIVMLKTVVFCSGWRAHRSLLTCQKLSTWQWWSDKRYGPESMSLFPANSNAQRISLCF